MKRRLVYIALVLAVVGGMVSLSRDLQAQGSLRQVAEAYFSDGPKYISAADLYENLNDGDAENDPYIISVRSPEDYAKGHIPGAVNMSPKDMFTQENLATIPPDRQIVVVCYTGQSACQVTAPLNMLGYDAYSLLFGMSSWTTDPDVYVRRFDPETAANDYMVETEPNEPGGPYALGSPLAADVVGAAQAYFSYGPNYITADALHENLNDGDPDNDLYVISIRSADDYAKGHIPGAVNMSVTEMFTADNLATIPPDRRVAVVCYTGQSASQVTAALNMLGYDACTLLHGMSSWTTDPDVYVRRFDPETVPQDYAVETEANEVTATYELPFTVTAAVGVAEAASAYFSEGPNYISATDLYENLNDGDAENDPYIISVRSAEDYAKGHVPGAVNMSVTEMFALDNLRTIPPERQVVVVCYTGQSACQVTAALNMLGYDAYSLLHGMSSWTTDPDVYVKRFNPETAANDYAVETEPNEPGGTYALPSPLAPGVAEAAQAYFSEGPNYISATDLYENLNDGDAENDPYIISVRSAEHYAKGHIPGAVNMSVTEMFTADNLATIPPERQVVVVCYTGQTACQVTAALNMLGYDAYSLLFGMSSWTMDPDVYVRRFDPETTPQDYAVETEANEATGTYELPFTVTAPAAVGVSGAANAYFSDGPNYISATDLYENLNDGDAENDPYIVSVRSAEDYAKGHVPGAVNMSVTEMFALDNLRTIPPERQVVVVCYTGQTACQVTAALNMLGYDAYSLLHGMSSWTTDPDVYVRRFNPETAANDYAVETEPNEPGGTYALPSPLAPGVAEAAQAYFSEGPNYISATDLYGNLNDGDAENDPYIISVRSAEDYAKGHIPGAVNMSVTEMFTADNLATIPPERQVVVVCYTGQTACQVTAALNMLGYDAYSLLFGMSSWTMDPDVYVRRFDPETTPQDYPVETEANEAGGPYELPTPLAAAGPEVGPAPAPTPPAAEIPITQAEATTCISCHTDKAAVQALAVEEEEEKVSEESTGEG